MRIKNTDAFTIKQTVTNVVSAIYVRIGSKAKGDAERILIEEFICKDLVAAFPNLTLKEFEIACYKGSMGDFRRTSDEVLFVSPEKIHGWIKLYVELVKREAIAKQREYEKKLDKEYVPSEEEKKKIEEQYLLRMQGAFEEFIATGVYSHHEPAHLLYGWLDRRGMIKITPQRKREIFAEVEANLKERLKDNGSSKRFTDVINSPEDSKAMFIEWAKHYAIEYLFKEINEMGMSLLEYIELNRS